MNTISRSNVYQVIDENEGKIFSCEFFKADGSLRTMSCRTGVKKHLAGGSLPYDPKEKGLLPVWEVNGEGTGKEAYRMVNVNTMTKLKVAGQEFIVVDLPNALSHSGSLSPESNHVSISKAA